MRLMAHPFFDVAPNASVIIWQAEFSFPKVGITLGAMSAPAAGGTCTLMV
jgi:hypothetical protein